MIKRILCALLVASGLIVAQVPPTVITIGEQQLAPVIGVTANYSGATGSTQYCYIVYVRYGVGNSQGSAPACVNNINTSGTVTVSWTVPNYGNTPVYTLTYDVVRLVNASVFPSSGTCSTCLLASATSALTATDTSAVLSVYTLTPYRTEPRTFSFDNTSTDRGILYQTVPSTGGRTQVAARAGSTLPLYCNNGDSFQLIGTGYYNCTANLWVAVGGGATPGTLGPVVQKAANYAITCADVAAYFSFQATAALTFTVPVNCTAGTFFSIFSPTVGTTTINLSTNSATANGQSSLVSLQQCSAGQTGCARYIFAMAVSGVNWIVTPPLPTYQGGSPNPPTCTAGAAVGTGSCSVDATSSNGYIIVSVSASGSVPTALNPVVTLTFATPWQSKPKCLLRAGDRKAANQMAFLYTNGLANGEIFQDWAGSSTSTAVFSVDLSASSAVFTTNAGTNPMVFVVQCGI